MSTDISSIIIHVKNTSTELKIRISSILLHFSVFSYNI